MKQWFQILRLIFPWGKKIKVSMASQRPGTNILLPSGYILILSSV